MSYRRQHEVETIFTQNEQEWLAQQQKTIEERHRSLMRFIDANKIAEAFGEAALIADELRTSILTPKKYYDLYIDVVGKLRDLEIFAKELNKRGMPMSEIYERAQYSTNVLSRLYVLICVGSVYIRSAEAPAKDILKDLVEMCKGVQHPVKGLFLRTYLSQMTKDKLPDATNSKIENGIITDSVDFILNNFVEMNMLWVRMQFHGSTRDPDKREKERLDVRTLVGTNLMNLAKLDGVDEEMYKTRILPVLLKEVEACRDPVAQHYLMEIIVQIFPCEFHLASLQNYLIVLPQLEDSVDVVDIVLRLIDRLAQFCTEHPDRTQASSTLFDILSSSINDVLKARNETVRVVGKLRLHEALLRLVLAVYPGNIQYIDDVYQMLNTSLSGIDNKKEKSDAEAEGEEKDQTPQTKPAEIPQLLPGDEVKTGLRIVILPFNQTLKSKGKEESTATPSTIPVLTTKDLLRLQHLTDVLNILPIQTRKEAAVQIITTMTKQPPVIDDIDILERLFDYVRPLCKEDIDKQKEELDKSQTSATQSKKQTTALQDELDQEQFESEQNNVSQIAHMIKHDNTDTFYKLLHIARKNFGKGGMKRVRYTLMPLFFVSLQLAERISIREKEGGEEQEEEDEEEEDDDEEEDEEGNKEKQEKKKEKKIKVKKEGDNKNHFLISSRKVFQFILEIVTILGKRYPEVAEKLCTQAMLCADRCGDATNTYEFMTQSCVIYEENIAESIPQFTALTDIIASLQHSK
ncbi:MAG: putative Vacuolar protein sorting-associated protein 35B, partial [Streblomastix strix]